MLRDCEDLAVEDWVEVFKVILHHLRYAMGNEVPGMPNMVIHLFEKRIELGHQWPELAESKEWIDKAVAMDKEGRAFWVMRKQSLIYAKLGDKQGAIEAAKRSLASAEAAKNADYVKLNKDSLKEWGAL